MTKAVEHPKRSAPGPRLPGQVRASNRILPTRLPKPPGSAIRQRTPAAASRPSGGCSWSITGVSLNRSMRLTRFWPTAKMLRVHGEATTRASWVDLADEQEAAVARFLSFPESAVPEVGAGRELVPAPADEAVPGLRDTVRNPNKTTALASAERMKLASNAHSMELAVDMAETIGARNSIERCLTHQLAVAHRMAMELAADAREEMAAYRRSDHLSPHRSIEASRMANTAARLMETCQRGALTLDRLRNGGRQVVQVQHVNVSDGGQAVVAGTIQPEGRGKRGAKT